MMERSIDNYYVCMYACMHHNMHHNIKQDSRNMYHVYIYLGKDGRKVVSHDDDDVIDED